MSKRSSPKAMAVILVVVISVSLFLSYYYVSEIVPQKTSIVTENKTSNTAHLHGASENVEASSFKSTYITEYSLPNNTSPNAILVDNNGMVWTAGSGSDTLLELDPKSADLTLYQIPEKTGMGDRMSWSMVEDKDNSIWFSQFGTDPLWRFDPQTAKFELFHTSNTPFQMKVDKTGDIWFTTLSGNTVGVVQKISNNTVTGGYKISEFPVGNGTYPSGLTLRGNSVWITELEKGKVAKFDVLRNSDGLITGIKKALEIPPTENKDQFSIPTDLLFSSNDTLWVTEHGTSTVTKYKINSGEFTRFATSQNRYGVASLPFWLRKSLDDQGIWFDEHEGGNVAFFNIKNETLTEFKLPGNSKDVIYMLNLATDPHNPCKAWFSEWNADKIGMVNRCLLVPFEIRSDLHNVVLSSESHQKIDVGVLARPGVPIGSNYTTVILNASSSMEPAAGFVNMSATFENGNTFDLTQVGKQQHFKLLLDDHSAPPGNYTLGISASDGIVTRTIFLGLIVNP